MAQIVTITNPLTGQPAQVDQLEHTAQQIDDAITRSLPGGAIDITLANNDPRQWGLGKTAGKKVASWDDAKENGWYIAPVPSGVGSGNIWGRVDCLSAAYLVQTVYVDNYKSSARRFRIGSVFGEWEWIDPPMHTGVEYRTTERYNGKPVYVKAVDFGTLPSASRKSVAHGASNVDKIISAYGFETSGTSVFNIPQYASAGDFVFCFAGKELIYVDTGGDLSGWSANVIIKYTKTTD